MELTEEQKLVTGIADYFNIEVPDIISEYVTDSVTKKDRSSVARTASAS